MKIRLFIDSGAYSAWTRGKVIDIDEYIAYLHEIIATYPKAEILYANLDVIGEGAASYKNWNIMRAEGLHPLPIYHASTDIKWLKRYLQKVDHIGLGAIANMSTPKRTWALDRLWAEFLIDDKQMPKVKVHGMGITSFPLMKRYPWHSIDSTSWLLVGAYGKVFLPRWRHGAWDFFAQPHVIAFSDDSPTRAQKGKHIDNVPPQVRRQLLDYLEFAGFKFGTNKKEKGSLVVVEEGVSNDHKKRVDLNAFFFAQFIQQLPYPRPFCVKRPKGLFT